MELTQSDMTEKNSELEDCSEGYNNQEGQHKRMKEQLRDMESLCKAQGSSVEDEGNRQNV